MYHRRNVKRNDGFWDRINDLWWNINKSRSSRLVAAVISLTILGLGALFIVYPGLGLPYAFYHSLNVNPVAWFLGGIIAITVFLAFNEGEWQWWGVTAVVLTVIWIVWMVLWPKLMVRALYLSTNYEMVNEAIPVVSMRPASYSEALTNMAQSPDARYGVGDLDYVRGQWIGDIRPNSGLNQFYLHSIGFFAYQPGQVPPVEIQRQEMPFAEGGAMWNSEHFLVHQRSVLTEYDEVIYVSDPLNDGYMAVVSLIGRKGFLRVPYLAEVMIIHANGRVEELTPAAAAADPRLDGVQLVPEWLAKRQCEAYGWREGIWRGMLRYGRIQVHTSSVNFENTAPYHMEAEDGMRWYTPFAPLGRDSQKGMCMQSSERPDNSVQIWELPGDLTYSSVDALATRIKGVTNRPIQVNWLRVNGDVRTGDTDIIELLPCPRREDGKVTFYMCGFVSTDPPYSTRFFTIVNVETLDVLQDVNRVSQINSWLRGDSEIPVLHYHSSENQSTASPSIVCGDPAVLSEAELARCIEVFAQELQRR
jgi:hypothetical protein